MKKVGIVTLYVGQNFGNKLQNYAVEQICLQNGFQPVTLKYEIAPEPVVEKKGKLSKLTPRHVLSYIKSKLSSRCHIKNSDTCVLKQFNYWRRNKAEIDALFKSRIAAYNVFDYKYLHYGQKTICLSESADHWTEEYAIFLSGSDQVWNPYYQSVNEATFLRFAPMEKRAAIAGSFGVSTIPDNRIKDFARWLNEFRFLSVREEAGAKIITELCGKDAPILADPTMIVKKEVWDKVSKKPKFALPSKYILTYFLGDRTRAYGKFIGKIKQQYNLEVVNLLDIMQPQYLACDPAEFIFCVANADIVCTDSFHATVFSILYKVPFVTFDRAEGTRSMGSRINTLLKNFNLQYRKFENIRANIDECFQMDFEDTDKHLLKLRESATKYLDKIFAAATANCSMVNQQDFKVYKTDACTGCGACITSCPTKALIFKEKNGFLYPDIDIMKCIDCRNCARVCPVQNGLKFYDSSIAYAMRNNNNEIVSKSSSGGVISAISEEILKNGVVYGAAFDDNFELKHVRVDTLSNMTKIRKSKYLQSEIAHCFAQIKQDLKNEKQVLFIGTPCQVAAVNSLFGMDDRLFTVSIVCHGVPSPSHWKAYKQELEKKHGSRLKNFDFRDKSTGWKAYSIAYEFENGYKHVENPIDNAYMRDFYHNKSLRASCGNCSFKAGASGADITVGDFWGLKTLGSTLDDDKGVSVVVVHSCKGRALLNSIKNIDCLGDFDLYEAMGENPSYFYSSVLKR